MGESAANLIADLLLEEYEYLHLPFATDTVIELLVLHAVPHEGSNSSETAHENAYANEQHNALAFLNFLLVIVPRCIVFDLKLFVE